jgi:hypothetical protein
MSSFVDALKEGNFSEKQLKKDKEKYKGAI